MRRRGGAQRSRSSSPSRSPCNAEQLCLVHLRLNRLKQRGPSPAPDLGEDLRNPARLAHLGRGEGAPERDDRAAEGVVVERLDEGRHGRPERALREERVASTKRRAANRRRPAVLPSPRCPTPTCSRPRQRSRRRIRTQARRDRGGAQVPARHRRGARARRPPPHDGASRARRRRGVARGHGARHRDDRARRRLRRLVRDGPRDQRARRAPGWTRTPRARSSAIRRRSPAASSRRRARPWTRATTTGSRAGGRSRAGSRRAPGGCWARS